LKVLAFNLLDPDRFNGCLDVVTLLLMR